MTGPEHPEQPEQDPVSLSKEPAPSGEPVPGVDFDPYRFGAPEQPIPPQYPPHYPPPPPYLGYGNGPQGQLRAGHGKAVAALVLGIASIVLCWLTLFDAIPVVLAVVFGALAIRESRFKPHREGRSMAIAGIVCAVIGALLAVALTVLIYTRFKDCLKLNPGSSEYSTCIRDHL